MASAVRYLLFEAEYLFIDHSPNIAARLSQLLSFRRWLRLSHSFVDGILSLDLGRLRFSLFSSTVSAFVVVFSPAFAVFAFSASFRAPFRAILRAGSFVLSPVPSVGRQLIRFCISALLLSFLLFPALMPFGAMAIVAQMKTSRSIRASLSL